MEPLENPVIPARRLLSAAVFANFVDIVMYRCIRIGILGEIDSLFAGVHGVVLLGAGWIGNDGIVGVFTPLFFLVIAPAADKDPVPSVLFTAL